MEVRKNEKAKNERENEPCKLEKQKYGQTCNVKRNISMVARRWLCNMISLQQPERCEIVITAKCATEKRRKESNVGEMREKVTANDYRWLGKWKSIEADTVVV
ncbi:unnamed protein product [Acanthocheilonema viteae]|uniref:Uncharacterized protein n=1 Tax=Acanthocheilonema viteae TaxID=6277 RepID=A0A498S580_ACAVI|nr:unnamed protein product [Acanthocheilonema viteae]